LLRWRIAVLVVGTAGTAFQEGREGGWNGEACEGDTKRWQQHQVASVVKGR
jgi:hypothetical protein